ncbi:MAG TPA: (2Fe-2S)-binding protein [Intrasporangium sp.]|jgi:bacterioferritin-associated ferredoxin|uniref:(2Fe-2S)-binding protein n=1 Tax=Intrasporangium sp. TaxID=1925024 RepID=UPI002F958045
MIVCQCAVVSDRDVTAAYAAGARTLAQACMSTGAGRDCGSCVFSVKRLVCEHGETFAMSPTEVEVAAS